MPRRFILDNTKVKAEIEKSRDIPGKCSIPYSYEMRKKAMEVFSDVLRDTNEGEGKIAWFLRDVKHFIDRKSVHTRGRDGELQNKICVSLGDTL